MSPFDIRDPRVVHRTEWIDTGAANLCAAVAIPPHPDRVVVFADGVGSTRTSPRNRFVANVLGCNCTAAVLVDLLTDEEALADTAVAKLRYDIGLLARRLIRITEWLGSFHDLRSLPVGWFAAGTAAGAALVAAAEEPERTRAIVSRGGRPELAGEALRLVRAPTLLIVGGADGTVLDYNREAYAKLTCEKRLEIVAGATHMFEEPGALGQVADLTVAWFAKHLR